MSAQDINFIDFTLSNAKRFYSSMGNPLDRKGLSYLNRDSDLTVLNSHQRQLRFHFHFISISDPDIFPSFHSFSTTWVKGHDVSLILL